MLLRSFVYFFILFACLIGLSGCSKDYPPFIYETVDMTLSNADNSGETPVQDWDSVPKEAYAIEMNLTMVMKDKTGADINESSYNNEDVVTQFTITSLQTFNGISPNQSLNHLFNYSAGGGTGSAITSDNSTSIFSGSNRSQSGNSDQWTTIKDLLLMYPPANPGNYSFIVSATFSDARILTDTINVKLY